ncbi:MAG: Smr/MutS family protein [Bacteroidales bacterium]|nr:Smr/MutS family protein [Candidatus Colimorpha onthohippi]
MLEEKIGFDRIRSLVASHCTNELAVRMTDEMLFLTDYERIVRNLQQTEEMRRIVMFESSFPSQDFFDLSAVLSALSIENTIIEQQSLSDLRCSLQTISACQQFLLNSDTDSYPQLRILAERVSLDPNLIRQVCRIIDEKGEIYDNASPHLLEIRRMMLRKRNDVDSCLNRSLSHAKQEGWAPADAEITIRNGRLVIPMLDSHRRKIKGLIHDESATRQTAYLEPSEAVELNNDLRELTFEEHHEIQRILLSISNIIRPQLPQLQTAYWFLARIDFIRAKARVALQMNAGLPIVNNATLINWLDARHPLLLVKMADQDTPSRSKKEVVPFNMSLSPTQRILIISGPNAGGKSVCLKAVGLIQYMLQCGMLVPCRETSEFGIFERIFIDIGDQQSIDNDLSTYTSHLQNMKRLLSEANHNTLFLLDELGGGTEPRSGCAIAEALLEEMDRREAFGVVTTHFADLKLLADNHSAIVNGAMLYDTNLMRPLYQLSIGHPGSSFAFEIAQSVGFPTEILEAAGQKVGQAMLNFEHQLQQLEVDKQSVAKQRAELDATDAFLAEVLQKYQRLTADIESRRREMIAAAKQEAREIMAGANRIIEQTISDIKTAQAEKQQTLEARRKLQLYKESIADNNTTPEPIANQKHTRRPKPLPETKSNTNQTSVSDSIAVGRIVSIDGQQTYGEVVEIKGKKAIVESNSLRMTIPIDRLTVTAKQHIPIDKSKQQHRSYQSIYNDINEKRKCFNPTIDLRGQRADDAICNLQHFFDDAMLLSEKELRILHGKGNGILKQIIREWLQSNRDVASFKSEHVELGGDGITLVSLH